MIALNANRRWRLTCATLTVLALTSTGCAMLPDEPIGPVRKEVAVAVTKSNQLLSFNAGQPQKILSRKPLTGMLAGETLVGIDYRVARGQLYGLSSTGRLLRLDTGSGSVEAVGTALVNVGADVMGFDFNPTVDRIRIVASSGSNLRLHPDTGAMVDGDANTPGVQPDKALAYDAGDASAGKPATIVAAGYTYNKVDDKLTTNYAIDAAQGTLVMQGSKEGTTPAVSPNTGRLTTVGKLDVPAFARASFDIDDLSNAAFLATEPSGAGESRWYGVDLGTGKARFIGTIRAGEAVVGVAIEP